MVARRTERPGAGSAWWRDGVGAGAVATGGAGSSCSSSSSSVSANSLASNATSNSVVSNSVASYSVASYSGASYSGASYSGAAAADSAAIFAAAAALGCLRVAVASLSARWRIARPGLRRARAPRSPCAPSPARCIAQAGCVDGRCGPRVGHDPRGFVTGGVEHASALFVEPTEEPGDLFVGCTADGRGFLHRVGDDWVALLAPFGLGVSGGAGGLEFGFCEQGARFGFGGAEMLGRERGAAGGVDASLSRMRATSAGEVRLGADRSRLLRCGRVRGLADVGGGCLGGDQLELRSEPRLPQGGDGVTAQPLDLLLRASTLARLFLVRHGGPTLRTVGPLVVHGGEPWATGPRPGGERPRPAVRSGQTARRAPCSPCAAGSRRRAHARRCGAWPPRPTPAPAADPAPPPGDSVAWSPTGRQALGRPVLYTGSANGGFVAWMDPQLTRLAVVPGTGDPLGSPWGGQVLPAQQPFLVSSFNGGFKWGDFDGGVIAFGASYRSPVPGEASLIAYDDGSYTVGAWGRDNDPAKQVVALRQNLGMLVDGGAPTAAASNPGAWGASVAGVATARGGVGVDANGGLVWAGGRISPLDLANTLVAAGAVRGMQLDINPDWVGFNSYDVGRQRRARQRPVRRDRHQPLPEPRRPRLRGGVHPRDGRDRRERQTRCRGAADPGEGQVARSGHAVAGDHLVEAAPRALGLVPGQTRGAARAWAAISGSSAARWIRLGKTRKVAVGAIAPLSAIAASSTANRAPRRRATPPRCRAAGRT